MKKFIAFLFVNELKTKYSAGEEVTKFKQKGHSNPQQVERTAAAATGKVTSSRKGTFAAGWRQLYKMQILYNRGRWKRKKEDVRPMILKKVFVSHSH